MFGRKPTGELTVSNNSMEKENREPEVVILSRAQLIKKLYSGEDARDCFEL